MKSESKWQRWIGTHGIDLFKDAHGRRNYPANQERLNGRSRTRQSRLSPLILIARTKRKARRPYFLPGDNEYEELMRIIFFGQ